MAKVVSTPVDPTFIAEYNLLKGEVDALRASILVITAQLDLDGGVTDTDYAANADPAAHTSDTIVDSSEGIPGSTAVAPVVPEPEVIP